MSAASSLEPPRDPRVSSAPGGIRLVTADEPRLTMLTPRPGRRVLLDVQEVPVAVIDGDYGIGFTARFPGWSGWFPDVDLAREAVEAAYHSRAADGGGTGAGGGGAGHPTDRGRDVAGADPLVVAGHDAAASAGADGVTRAAGQRRSKLRWLLAH